MYRAVWPVILFLQAEMTYCRRLCVRLLVYDGVAMFGVVNVCIRSSRSLENRLSGGREPFLEGPLGEHFKLVLPSVAWRSVELRKQGLMFSSHCFRFFLCDLILHILKLHAQH